MKKKLTALLVGAALMLAATAALAIPINGSIGFTGTTSFTPGGSTIVNATGLDFINAHTELGASSGIYLAIPNATAVTFTDFTFDSSSFTTVSPLWTLTAAGKTYSFNLTDIDFERSTLLGNKTQLHLVGNGILSATNYEDTAGVWDFTTQANNNRTTGVFTFSSGIEAAPVPEPGTMVLLGFGMLGLAVYGKRRRNSKEA